MGVMSVPTTRIDRGAMTHEAPAREFRVWVDGRLSERFAAGLPGVEQRDGTGGTLLLGDYVDEAHLQGVLDELRRLGITVCRFEVVEERPEEERTSGR